MLFRRSLRFIAASILTLLSVYAFAANPDSGDLKNGSGAEHGFRLTGSWIVDVVSPNAPEFYALQTFHSGGTVSETTDLLAQGGEGPGHGVWTRDGDRYAVTFELFIFNPDATPAGRIRVRETIEVSSESEFDGVAIADLLLPDGEIIENIDTAPIHGKRIEVVPVRPEELHSQKALPQYSRSWRRSY